MGREESGGLVLQWEEEEGKCQLPNLNAASDFFFNENVPEHAARGTSTVSSLHDWN